MLAQAAEGKEFTAAFAEAPGSVFSFGAEEVAVLGKDAFHGLERSGCRA
ncbi:hypothetical protein EI77_02779 [Prosthecobacter fusiformis]|uniref:Uncharacterized protein n=1 Tax=Prosthecobacter fusiformis TaxID=48464 RepID=A0A4R7RY21_9BACT|nr:hypothetical protein EI77_02779 [Prosthecobacter fusiformis]